MARAAVTAWIGRFIAQGQSPWLSLIHQGSDAAGRNTMYAYPRSATARIESAMSMYAQFLSIALDQASQSDGPPTTGQALGQIVRSAGAGWMAFETRVTIPSGAPDALSR